MNDLRQRLSPSDFDVLRELSNVGAGHATTILSSVVGRRRVALSVPRVELLRPAGVLALVGGADVDLVAIELGLAGLLEGRIVIAFTRESARSLTALVLGTEATEEDELGRSALLEVGNIVTSSYLNALAKLVHAPLVPTPPTLRHGPAHAVLLDTGARGSEAALGEALVLVNEFAVESARFIGYFLVFPHPGSLDACLAAAREPAP